MSDGLNPEDLGPGSDLDARGAVIDDELMAKLMAATEGKFGHADFSNARFTGRTAFPWARFRRALFTGAEFEAMEEFGPIEAEEFVLDRATFARWLWIEPSAKRISCQGTTFNDGVSLRVGAGVVDATGTVFGSTSTIMSRVQLWPRDDDYAHDTFWPRGGVVSLRDTDVSNLVIVDMELDWCLFAGAHRLDQLRLEGRIKFNHPPFNGRWTLRQILAEELFVRRLDLKHPYIDGHSHVEAGRVAALYRSLRKSFEDSKNEAGAGDFYYGEMEMRRRAVSTRQAERRILAAYWLLSGYGQRAGRAIIALGVVVTVVCVAVPRRPAG